MNPYRKHTEVYQDLVKLIETNLAAGRYFLPPETTMARQFSTSRMTLRKALETASMNGLITRENKRTTINTVPYPNLRQCGKMLFVACTIGQNFYFPAVERLWLHLLPEIRLNLGGISLLAVDPDLDIDVVDEAVRHADLIFLTTNVFAQSAQEYFNAMLKKAEKAVFGLFDPFFNRCPYGITLDNLEVGRLAAEALYQSGTRKVIVFSDNPKNPHTDRIRGFRAEFSRRGGEVVLAAKRKEIPQPVYYLACRTRIMEAYENGCDGAFLTSDEGIDIILMDLFKYHLIPEKFKVISVNGSGQALRHNPPISCVNHATTEVVAEILRQLQEWGKNPVHRPFHIKVKPDLYKTNSI